MPEPGSGTQGRGKYCGKVCRLILYTWNGEIPLIIDLPPVFSVEIAVAGTKNGCFWVETQGSFYQAMVL